MSDREEALRQLDEIKSALLDSEKFMPYNTKALFGWAIISIILFLTACFAFQNSFIFGGVYLTFFFIVGFLVEYYCVKKENRRYDLSKWTKLQMFIVKLYVLLIFIGIILTLILHQNSITAVAYILWILLISFGNYLSGLLLNIKAFENQGVIGISISSLLFISTLFIDNLSVNSNFLPILGVIGSVVIGGGYIYLSFVTKREFNNV